MKSIVFASVGFTISIFAIACGGTVPLGKDGVPTDAALAADQFSDGGGAGVCVVGGITYAEGSSWSEGCNACGCASATVSCTANVCDLDGGQLGGRFSCGPKGLTCLSGSEFCYNVQGGVPDPDGGVRSEFLCKQLPNPCKGAAASCACVKANSASCVTMCSADISNVSVVCQAP
jgi:hypothetical protein